ncbi:hypothetical protein [Nostoc sp.]|uniref:hypothetical protein n=1 Tax=Nostoc sp. TaxID=1180 RepID=UPI002FFCBD28
MKKMLVSSRNCIKKRQDGFAGAVESIVREIPQKGSKQDACPTQITILASSDRARVGTLTSDCQEFLSWRTIDGEDFPAKGATELEVLIQGIFDKRRLLEQVLHLIVFEENRSSISKKLLRRPFCTTQYLKKSLHQGY